jgi:hypothetical protein
MDDTVAEIAEKYLDISTLKTQNSDSLDFHQLAVWQIEEALVEAFLAGKREGINTGY